MKRTSFWTLTAILPATVAGLLSALYVATLSPYLSGGDSGELIVNALEFTTPHPPGYPLYLLLSRIFVLLPWSTPAWRVGLLSALSMAGAGAFLAAIIYRQSGRALWAGAIALAFGVSPQIWVYATQAEVMALNVFFISAMLYFWIADRPRAFALTVGLGAAHHFTLLLLALPLIARAWRRLAKPVPVLLALAPLSLYGILLYSHQPARLPGWGDLSNWGGFWTHVTRSEYGALALAATGHQDAGFWGERLGQFVRFISLQSALLGVVLAAIAVGRRARENWPLAVAFILFALAFTGLSNLDAGQPLTLGIQQRLWLAALPLVFALAAQVLSAGRVGQVGVAGWVILALALGGVQAGRSWRADSAWIENLARATLEPLAPGAVVLMAEDTPLNSLLYMQSAFALRPDVRVINLELLQRPWYQKKLSAVLPEFTTGANLRATIDRNVDRFPLYVPRLRDGERESLADDFAIYRTGLAARVRRKNEAPDLARIDAEATPLLRLKPPRERAAGFWDEYLIRSFDEMRVELGTELALHSAGRWDWVQAAITLLETVAADSPALKPLARKHLGFIYASLAPGNVRLESAAREAWQDYLDSRPPLNEETKSIQAELARLKAKAP